MHHAGLYNSLILLLEKRLGHQLYRPIGMDWYDQGYWMVYNHPDTARQYLMDGYYPKDHTPPLNSVTKKENGIHYIHEYSQNCTHKAITLEQFKEMDIDVVIASIPAHIPMFKKLIKEFKPKAKFIFQMGNMFNEVNFNEIPNLLASTIDVQVPPTCNAVFYHQEFDLNLFKPSEPVFNKKITSFINLLPSTGWGTEYYQMKSEMPEYEFRSYGILTDNGIINGVEKISNIMRDSMFGWHAKWGGDGFGHILYNWYATGRPVITHISDYMGKLGGELLRDGETCIDIQTRGLNGTINYIREISNTHYQFLCQQAYKVFQEKVNFDDEEVKVKNFLERLN